MLRLSFYKESHSPVPLLLLFRKKLRSAHLFGCKRPHNGSLSLTTFCEYDALRFYKLRSAPFRCSRNFRPLHCPSSFPQGASRLAGALTLRVFTSYVYSFLPKLQKLRPLRCCSFSPRSLTTSLASWGPHYYPLGGISPVPGTGGSPFFPSRVLPLRGTQRGPDAPCLSGKPLRFGSLFIYLKIRSQNSK